MSMTVNKSTSPMPPLKAAFWARQKPDGGAPAGARDEAVISGGAKQALAEEEEPSPVEKALRGTTREDVQAWMKDWQTQHQLDVNWNAVVDPDHSIYAKSYMESLARQYDETRQTVEAYYQEGHQENLRFSNPYNHLVEKYKFSGSPYFKGDWSQAQRDMAFRQEEALLQGGRVALNDPWALAASGGVPNGEAVDKAARAYAQSVIDGLIAGYKKANGVEE